MKKLILILYARGMYDQTALAIREYMSKHYSEYDIVLAEEDNYTNCYMSIINKYFYIATSRNATFLNNLTKGFRQSSFLKNNIILKELDDTKKQKQTKNKLITRFSKIANLIKRFNPSIIICTTPLSHVLVTKCMQRQGFDIPMYISISDYALNKAFVNKFADGYFVQNKMIVQELQQMGIKSEKITIVGTPMTTNMQKSQKSNEQKTIANKQLRTTYKILNDLPIVTLIGGRYGSSIIKDYFASLSVFNNKINIVVMTGESPSLIKFVKSFCKSANRFENIVLIDKVDNMNDIYTLSDYIVSSPTSSITHEVLSKEIPCIVTKWINNVEKENYAYLTSNSFALRGEKKSIALNSLLNLLNDNEYQKEYIAKLHNQFDCNGAKTLSDKIVEILQPKKTNEELKESN